MAGEWVVHYIMEAPEARFVVNLLIDCNLLGWVNSLSAFLQTNLLDSMIPGREFDHTKQDCFSISVWRSFLWVPVTRWLDPKRPCRGTSCHPGGAGFFLASPVINIGVTPWSYPGLVWSQEKYMPHLLLSFTLEGGFRRHRKTTDNNENDS
jgi:hypothetical protein